MTTDVLGATAVLIASVSVVLADLDASLAGFVLTCASHPCPRSS